MTACICCETKSNDAVFITICKLDTDLWSSLGIVLILMIEVGFTFPTAQTNTVINTVPPIDVALVGSWSKISDVSKPRKYQKKMPIATQMQCRCGRFKRSRKIHVLVCVTTRWHKPLTNAVVTKTHAFYFRSVHIFLLPENAFWIFFHGAVVSSMCIMDIRIVYIVYQFW